MRLSIEVWPYAKQLLVSVKNASVVMRSQGDCMDVDLESEPSLERKGSEHAAGQAHILVYSN
jgi:hypothetical protein